MAGTRRTIVSALAGALIAGVLASVPAAPAGAVATVTVTTTADTMSGSDGVISLREAIAQAESDGTAATTIVLGSDRTYRLTNCALDGGLLDVVGGGPLTLDANGSTIEQTCPGVSVLEYGSDHLLRIDQATITGGNCDGSDCLGGAVGVSQGGSIVEVYDSTFVDNSTADPSGGGALFTYDLGATIVRSHFIGNESVSGGSAIRATGPLVIEDSSFFANTATTGPAVFAADVAEITNTTFADNRNDDLAASAFYVNDLASDVSIAHSTFVSNDSPQLSVYAGTYAGTILVDPVGGPNCNHPVGATVTSTGFNRTSDTSCGLDGTDDLESVGDLGLRSVFRNGGGGYSLYPEEGSPLVDTVPDTDTDLPDADQRGVLRPQFAGGDIGAIEVDDCGVLFHDITGVHEFCWEIGWLAGSGVTTGLADGGYHPGDEVTRGSMAAFMYRLAGSPRGDDPACTTAAFPDVPASHAFCGEIDWLADEDIAGGFGDGTYRPADGVTRSSMAAFMYRLAGNPDGDDPTCKVEAFPDVPTSHPFCGEIAWLVDVDITTGFLDGTYRPAAPVTRQSMAAFMYRLADDELPVP
jgi:hypothetical protein